MRVKTRIQAIRRSLRLGAEGAGLFWFQWLREEFVSDHRLLELRVPGVPHSVVYRANTSDAKVFRQIFLDGEYESVNDLPGIALVIDCGANAGYSAVYFLTRFPYCQVIAVEPDPETFAVLERNVAAFGTRVKTVNSAVWSHPANLKLVDDYRDGEPWSRMVRETASVDPESVSAVDVAGLLHDSGHERISLLKVDIEGAEGVVFADAPWIDKVDNIVIELHDDSPFGDCSSVFFKAIAHRDFAITQLGERTICRAR